MIVEKKNFRVIQQFIKLVLENCKTFKVFNIHCVGNEIVLTFGFELKI
jgi:hypothetical protein